MCYRVVESLEGPIYLFIYLLFGVRRRHADLADPGLKVIGDSLAQDHRVRLERWLDYVKIVLTDRVLRSDMQHAGCDPTSMKTTTLPIVDSLCPLWLERETRSFR